MAGTEAGKSGPGLLTLLVLLLLASALGAQGQPQESAQELFQQGHELRTRGNREAALELYARAWALEPESPRYGAFLAWYLEQGQDHSRAVDVFRQSLGPSSESALYRASYARSLRALEQHREAAREFHRSWELGLTELRQSPRSPVPSGVEADIRWHRAWLHLFESGRSLYSAGDFRAAQPSLAQSLEQNTGSYRDFMLNRYGEILYREGRLAFHGQDYEQAARLFAELEALLDIESLDMVDMLNRYTAYYYGLSYGELARNLARESLPGPQQTLRVLCVYGGQESLERLDWAETHRKQELFSRLVQYLSRGAFAVVFQDLVLENPQDWTFFTTSSYQGPDGEALEVLDPLPTGRALLARLRNQGLDLATYDSLAVYTAFPTEQGRPSSSVLHARQQPDFPPGRERMGLVSFPLAGTHDSEMVLLHEFFHLWENLYSVSPKHGFSPHRSYRENLRVHFPHWQGEGQFSYYEYHFRNTFARDAYQGLAHP